MEGVSEALSRDTQELDHPVMALDGAAQWTCSPNSTAEVPDSDELYDRRADPFQLNNIIADNPETAARLLMELTDAMDAIRES